MAERILFVTAIREEETVQGIERTVSFPEGYPDGRTRGFRGLKEFSEADADASLTPGVFVVEIRGLRFVVGIGERKEKMDTAEAQHHLLGGIQRVFKSLITITMHGPGAGFYSRTQFRKESSILCEIEELLRLLSVFPKLVGLKQEASLKEKYRGNRGQVACAKDLQITHLYSLSAIARLFGIEEEMGWTEMNVTRYDAEKFLALVETEEIFDFRGDVQKRVLAKTLGIHVLQLYTVASGFGVVLDLEWTSESRTARNGTLPREEAAEVRY